MLTDRTLLGSTLALTFVAGGATGWVAAPGGGAHRGPPRPYDAAYVYERELSELRARGYDETELREALAIHQQYIDSYKKWWDECCVTYDANLSVLDRKFEDRRAALEKRFAERTSGTR